MDIKLAASLINHFGMINNPNCQNCNGSGKTRKNRSKDGKYIFGKATCTECLGSGIKIWYSAVKRAH